MASSRFLAFGLVATALIAALSLGASYAHVLEAAPRLAIWSPELWREATVFNGQFRYFAIVGGPIDLIAIAMPAVLAFLLRRQRPAMILASLACACYALALALWFGLVAPANAVLATWTPGPIPADFEAVRHRWETGHMAVAGAKAVGFLLVAAALAAARVGRERC